MSFNLLKNVDLRKFSKLIGKPLTIQEKFDTFDFWISISENSVCVMKNGKPVSVIDRFLNPMYDEVGKYVFSRIDEAYRRVILEQCGNCSLHVFYFPSDTPYNTYYPNYKNKNFIVLSDIWFDDPQKAKDKNKYMEIIKDITKLPTATLNTINCTQDIIDNISLYKEDKIDIWNFARIFADETETLNHCMEQTYGILVKSEKNTWQIPIREYERIKYDSMHSQYRDVILHDFVRELIDNKALIDSVKQMYVYQKEALDKDSETSYINAMAFMFLCYINKTDIFKKYYMEPYDIMPIHHGFIPGAQLDMLDDMTVYMMCKHNILMQCVLKLLVHTFYNINLNTFNIFNELETRAISNFISIFYE